MNILYHLTILPPKMPSCVAEIQEIDRLRDHFGGDLVYLNPNERSPIYVPRLFFGFQKLRALRERERDFDLHHVYNPDPFPFPVLSFLDRPVVYSISGGVGHRRPNVGFFNSLAAVVVADERSLRRLESWGVNNAFLVHAGIDTARFTHTPLPLRDKSAEIRLMVGSAPWTRAQFRTKGVEALLAVAQRDSRLRLIFLWRGEMAEEMERRVRVRELEERVEILKQKVDVNEVLASVHASVTLASARGIVKSYPHSLIESLAAGKPVLVSRAIPMADYVEEKGCGLVVEEVTPSDVLAAIEALVRNYGALQESARRVGQRDFLPEKLVTSFQRVYEHVLGRGQAG
jgi:glycosyltransferase involved in cell wall biosynthesis